MACESGLTHLDGRPVPPYVTPYYGIMIVAILLAAFLVSLISMIVYDPVSPIRPWMAWLYLILVLAIVIPSIITEYKERIKVYKLYNHKLEVYNRRRQMVINNGGKWKNEIECYHDMFTR